MDPGQFKVLQEGAERAEEEQPTLRESKIDAGRTRAGEAVHSRTIKTMSKHPRIRRASVAGKLLS